MTQKEIYTGLYIAKNKVNDLLFLELCSRVGAPGSPASVFADYKIEAEGIVILHRVQRYIKNQLEQQFLQMILTR